MLRHPLYKMWQKMKADAGTMKGTVVRDSQHGTTDIDELHVLSRKGLWALLIFLGASAIALLVASTGSFTGALSLPMRELLGMAPPLVLMDLVFAVSTLSSLLIIAGPLHAGGRPGRTWPHLGFRVVFYILYFCMDSLGSRFDAIFISGIVVLALQHYSLWRYATTAIEAKMAPPHESSLHGAK